MRTPLCTALQQEAIRKQKKVISGCIPFHCGCDIKESEKLNAIAIGWAVERGPLTSASEDRTGASTHTALQNQSMFIVVQPYVRSSRTEKSKS